MAGTFSQTGDVTVVITGRDVSQAAVESAVAGVKKVQNTTDRMVTATKRNLQILQKSWLGYSAVVAAVAIAIKKGWNLAEKAADYAEQMHALDMLGKQYGLTAQEISRATKEAARGLISIGDSSKMAADAMNKGLSPDQIYAFTRACETLTDITGDSVPEAFNRMVTAAATGRAQTLAQMGVIIDLQKAYETYAGTLGKSAQELTEQEKLQARLTTILGQVQEKAAALGPTVDTARDKMDRFRMKIKDINLMLGTVFIRVGAAAVGVFNQLAAGAMTAYQGYAKLMQGLAALMSYLPGMNKEAWLKTADEWKVSAEQAAIDAQGFIDKSYANFELMMAKTTEISQAQAQARQTVREEEAEQMQVFEENYAAHNDRMVAAYNARNMAELNALKRRIDLEDNYKKQSEQAELKRAQLNAQYKARLQQAYANLAMAAIYMVSSFSQENDKKMFIFTKAVQIGLAILEGHRAAISAAAAVAGIPIIGPALAAQQYAQWMTTTYLNAAAMAMIAIGEYQRMGASPPVPPTSATPGAYNEGSENPYTTEPAAEKPSERPIIVNYYNYGVTTSDMDKVGRELAPVIRKAIADGA